MIPSILSSQLRRGLKDYIDTTFQITTPLFKDVVTNLVNEPNKVFREPFVSVKLPFRKGNGEKEWFEGINLKFPPYVHQEKAFERLRANAPKSTLVATGTGSGKTECFLYPILEYCYKHRGEQGIKAVLIYPMNALATDQARRLAELINSNENLRGNVRAGMFVGDKEDNPSRVMSKEKIITDREMLREYPPDILLTNYKMLDYLLIRPDDAVLWRNNNSQSLKFIVVDEIHTFDGAQGTDLAALLRRLKSRLETPTEGYLCCVGTSATMGSKSQGKALVEYANNIFGEVFDEESIVTEDRLKPYEYLEGFNTEYIDIPSKENIDTLREIANSNIDEKEYIKRAIKVWYNIEVDANNIEDKEFKENLVILLKKTKFFREVIEILDGKSLEYLYIYEEINNIYKDFGQDDYQYFIGVLDSLLAMISYARVNKADDLQVQIQFWFRELRRMLAKVDKDVSLEMADDLNEEQKKYYLPTINCRECGATGWVSMENENNSLSISDLSVFYNNFFSNDKKRIKMLFPIDEDDQRVKNVFHVCPKCMILDTGGNGDKCSNCGNEEMIKTYLPSLEEANNKKGKSNGFICPCCGSNSGLSLVGAQSATLISSGISEIFASKYNDDKKLLTFSDSVQDASHRAGFFSSRTWRFNLRTAIQKFLLDKGQNLSLIDFARAFNEYWLGKLGKEAYVATFIPPDLTWRRAFENMVATGYLGETEEDIWLINNIKDRVELEIYYEYGFNSRIGRTLEKSGASILAVNKNDINSVIDKIYLKLQNEIGELRNLPKEILSKVVIALIIKLKNNGAIYKECLNSFIYYDGNNIWLSKTKKPWMAGVGRARQPKFLSGYRITKNINDYDVITKNSWYQRFIEKSFNLDLIREDLPFEVYSIILKELKEAKILISIETNKKNLLYGINDKAISVVDNVKQISCDKCGHTISISQDEDDICEGMSCFRKECSGSYSVSNSGLDFYGKLYSNGDVCRIFAKEHTGLLEREPRESVENEFKKARENQSPWDTNLLSCTPTLEMGIDIGDLSTVVLCSVPPGQAQYQQRVGRAGRRDGNALNIVVANSKPHDLYFYEDPSEMISGVVDPPAIFLDASAVLERQLTAYCFDWWVKSGNAAVPKTIDKVIANINKKYNNLFPYNFLNYVENNLSWILKKFKDIFGDKLSQDSIKQLDIFAYGEGTEKAALNYKIINSFTELEKHRESLKKDIASLNKAIKKLEVGVQDKSIEEEKLELEQERSTLKKIVEDINGKNIFNFLSDEGLLPNYAFPEAGVILKAVIYRKRNEDNEIEDNDDKKRKYDNYIHEYNRAAMAAIQELAPENAFYAEGRKLTIDQIDVKLSEPELWRLCPSCTHAQIEIKDKNAAQCPRCGHPGWSDSGQVRQLLRLKMVYSNVDYVKSKSGDESDEREQKFFCRQMLVDVDTAKDITHAYKIDDEKHPFGFEFIKKATLREINFGEVDNVGEKLTVAGREEVRKGFKVCKYCGKVKAKGISFKHAYTCVGKNKPDSETIEESLYLYREFTSEAIRMLIPSTSVDSSETRLQTFISALMLGLKRHFGSVDHLRVCITEEPVKDSAHRKSYLVLYDTVPGGTGYLKELMSSSVPMMEIFQKALDAVKACSCYSDDKKDGCYKCLYAYKQSRHIGQISSRAAVEMLSEILKNKNKVKEIKSINDIKINALFDSELEKRFIEALARSSNANRTIEVNHQVVNGKPGYSLKINDLYWEVEPQVELGIEDGIIIPSKPDFILWPVRNKDEKIKPIAIFTDGYTYHKNIIGEDMAKRMAIIQSGKFYVWSLTWKDVESVFQYQGEYYENYLSPNVIFEKNKYGKDAFRGFINNLGLSNLLIHNKDSFKLLLLYLEDPQCIIKIHDIIFAYILGVSNKPNLQTQSEFKNWLTEVEDIIGSENNMLNNFKKSQSFYGKTRLGEEDNEVEIFTAFNYLDMASRNIKNTFTLIKLEDRDRYQKEEFESVWNGYLNMMNLFQFKENSLFITTKGIENNLYNEFFKNEDIIYEVNEELLINEYWEENKDYVDDIMNKLIEVLLENNVDNPDEIGYELINENEEVIALCEIAWINKKVAILTEEQEKFKEKFNSNGWNCYIITKDETNFKEILEKLK